MQEPVDVTSLRAVRRLQAPGQPDAVARIVSHFLVEAAERLETLDRATQSGDTQALERTAHALKGIAGTVGANEMLKLAVRLEQLGRAGRTHGAAALVSQLKTSLQRARPIFEQLIHEAGPTRSS